MLIKKLLFTGILVCLNMAVFSQIDATIDESGEKVFLYDDGTWQYASLDSIVESAWDTVITTKPKSATFLLKSNKLKYGVWFDKKKWSYNQVKNNAGSPAEFNFRLSGEDAYAMIIAERIEIPVENLLEITLENAREAASDISVVKEEVRIVNGVLVHFRQMEGTIQGIKFVYLSYYFSDENGSIQFVTYTSKNLLISYRKSLEDLLNGLVLLN